ncbi:hypothetical protein E2320_013780 [Naja naja]|nr:hypothetical protein E2320_013780 [Naja naja]
MGVASVQVSTSAPCRSLHIKARYKEVALLLRLPATLSLTRFMGRSRLPLPSLLGLFGALLMLSPHLLLWIPVDLYNMPINDPEVRKAMVSAVEQYNQDGEDSANYFKVFRALKTQWKVPMGRSWLPLRSLLSLFSALLMLSPQLLRVNAQDLYDAPINHPYVQKALAFAVERYNLDNEESANYFKVMQILKTQWKVGSRVEYHLTVELVKTTCKKEIGKIKQYKKIQKCRYVEVTLLLHLPVTLSLACFMGCSRLPLPSLLSLLGALLMLSPQLLMVNAVDLFDVAVNGPEMQKAVISAVDQYNQDREDSANYFKLLRILDIKARGIALIQYHMLVELVKTTCKKKMGEIRKYKKIQECKELPGNPEIRGGRSASAPASDPLSRPHHGTLPAASPLPSLLGLFGALLRLPPQLLTMNAKDFYDALVNQPYVQKTLTSAVEQYNQEREDSANYFKLLLTLSLAGPMRSSRLSFPSLLGLFGALLILSPQLLTVNSVRLHDMPCNDRGVQKALASAVEQYNQERESSANYFKVLRIQDAKVQVRGGRSASAPASDPLSRPLHGTPPDASPLSSRPLQRPPDALPQLLMVNAVDLYDVPVNDPEVQKALAFAVEQYNQERETIRGARFASVLPVTLCLARPMRRSRLPLSSFRGLFGALLMLCPQLLLGIPEDFSDLPANDPGVKKALAFVVEQYNQDREDSANYFKVLSVLKAQSQANSRDEYRLTVDFVKTRCEKSRKMKYKRIQKCKVLQENPELSAGCFRLVSFSCPNPTQPSGSDPHNTTTQWLVPETIWLERLYFVQGGWDRGLPWALALHPPIGSFLTPDHPTWGEERPSETPEASLVGTATAARC